jgi:hypothetical protein
MKRSFLFVFILFFAVFSFAQKTVSGKIIDTDGTPVPSTSITVEETGKGSIIAYSISNAKGEFKITFTSSEPNVEIKLKAFNHKLFTKTIKNETQNITLTMESDATEIKEVKLKTKIITKKGDTISYDLQKFASKNDRTLQDVLKKVPGIDVADDGTISYQGEPINKFYVNGKDLMEGSYGIISKSLPIDAVQKVDVMENHQPVKILQDKVPSDKAAINVKLKNQVTMTGRGEIGAGFDPFLWNVKLTPMFFGQKNQWLVNYKDNNNGESVEKDNNILAFGSRWEGKRSQGGQNSWLSVENAETPNLPEKRYLMNNVHFFSTNLLTNIGKDWELKANASYSNNAISRDSYAQTVYGISALFPSGGFVSRQISNKFYSNNAKGELTFTKNAKQAFFKNTTSWYGFWNGDRADAFRVNTNNNVAANESLQSPTVNFQNSLSAILPWKDKLFNVMSYIKYQTDKQTLYTNPATYSYSAVFPKQDSILYDKLQQNLNLKTLEADHSVSVGFTYKKWTFTPEVGLNMNFNNMNSNLLGETSGNLQTLGLDFQNNIHWNEFMPYSQIGINYKSNTWNLNFTLPMNFYDINYSDNLRNVSKGISRTVFEPTFFSSLDFASFFKWWTFGNISYDFGSFGSLYGGNILYDPSSIGLKNSPLPENISRNIGTRIEYRNPMNNLFFNVSYRYGNTTKNLINSRIITDSINVSEIIPYGNTSFSQSESAEIGKYFPKAKTNISANFSNRNSNSISLLNGNFYTTKSTGQSAGLKFNTTYFSWMSLDYNINLNWSKNTNATTNAIVNTTGWNHNVALYFYPFAKNTIGFFWDQNYSKAQGQSYTNPFFDLSYQFSWQKKKMDFELKWLNIANKKLYQIINNDVATNSVSTTSINIRPSQVMFTVKFNFK